MCVWVCVVVVVVVGVHSVYDHTVKNEIRNNIIAKVYLSKNLGKGFAISSAIHSTASHKIELLPRLEHHWMMSLEEEMMMMMD
jgi:hypothetical protein